MYWNRPLLKANAKRVLSTSYWRVFVVCLIAGFLGGGLSSSVTPILNVSIDPYSSGYIDPHMMRIFSTTIIVGSIFALAFAIFVAAPILVGFKRFMMENRAGFPPIGSLFSVFKDKAQYLNVVKVMFQMNLEVFLWTLLCFVPGIYKSYQYFYIPYLLAENPYMSYSRAKELSRAMTNDEKMEIFVLELSFLGWEFLGAMLCGIGTLFVTPYITATFAELYASARAKAFALGVTNETELADFTHYDRSTDL